MKYVETLASYLPSLIVHHVLEHDTTRHPPARQSYNTVCMFADVSGFTALSEAMLIHGPEGAEHLAKHLNSYFGQMVRLIASEGGDIFKFAGDAMIVLWPDMDDMDTRVRRAAQCALAIQENLHNAKLAMGVTLSVKIGIGVGMVSVLHLGGALGRMEYVAVGEPLVQAFAAEHHAGGGGEVLMSPPAWGRVKEHFEAEEILSDGFARIKAAKTLLRRVNKTKMLKELDLENVGEFVEKRLRCYVPGAVLPWLNPDSPEQEFWGGDLRNVTCLFVNLGLKDHDLLAAAQYDEAMRRSHDVLVAVQTAVYLYEGSVNKFLMDDKGSTLIAVFGLPPLAHDDDPTRGVLAGLHIVDRLWDQGLHASVGITTGIAFCGVVGATSRKEYSVLGDIVNLSARLMQRAGTTGGGVICDKSIRMAANHGLQFQALGSITVKGKKEHIDIFRPYPDGIPLPTSAAPGSEPRLYKDAYETQAALVERFNLMNPHTVSEPPSAAASGGGGSGAGGDGPSSAAARKALKSESGSTKQRRMSKLAMAQTKSTKAKLTRTPESIKLRKLRNLVRKRVPPYSDATIPFIQRLAVKVPTGLSGDDYLVKNVDYKSLAPLSDTVSCEEGDCPSLVAMRDAVVVQAKRDGLIPADANTREFQLQIQGSDALVPLMELPTVWMAVFAVEYGAVTTTVRDGTLRVVLVKTRDQRALQSHHSAARQVLLQQKMQLLAGAGGGASLVLSEAGMGKTELLGQFVMHVLPKKTSVFCATASPYQRSQPFGVWAALANAFVGEYMPVCKAESRTAAVTHIIERYCDNDQLKALAGVLNPVLGLSPPLQLEGQVPVAQLRKLRRKHREDAVVEFLCMLVRAMCDLSPAMVIIDNGSYMDAESWTVALRVAAMASVAAGDKGGVPLLFIVASRPVPFYLDVAADQVPSGFVAMQQATYVSQLPLSRLPRDIAKELAVSLIGAAPGLTVAPRVTDFLEHTTGGCPLMIKEAVRMMVRHRKLTRVGGAGTDAADESLMSNSVSAGAGGGAHAAGDGSAGDGADASGVGGDVDFVAGFSPSVQMPVCRKVLDLMAYRVDRLTTVQQLILKCASMCVSATMPAGAAAGSGAGGGGDGASASSAMSVTMPHTPSAEAKTADDSVEFKFRVLFDAFPLDVYKRMLQDECDALEEMGLLQVTKTEVVAGSEGEPEPVYRFSSWFLREALRRRMLVVQREQLARSVKECVEKHRSDVRKMYMERMMESMSTAGGGGEGGVGTPLSPNKAGWLSVRKNVDGAGVKKGLLRGIGIKKHAFTNEWKRRWVTLSGTELRMYKDEAAEHSLAKPVQLIPLTDVIAESIPEEDLSKAHVFRVDSRSWVKKGKTIDDHRTFFMQASSAAEVEDWVFWIKFLAERVEMEKGRRMSRRRMSRRMSTRISRGIVSKAAADELGVEGLVARGNVLMATVERGEHMVPANVYSALCDPFVCLSIGGTVARTPPVRDTLNPTWGSGPGTAMLSVSVAQAARASVRFEVWDKDDYNADVMVGECEVPLASLSVESPVAESGSEAQARQAAAPLVTLELHGRGGVDDVYRGTLSLRLRLVLSATAQSELTADRELGVTSLSPRARPAGAGSVDGRGSRTADDAGAVAALLEDDHPVQAAMAMSDVEMSTARAMAVASTIASHTPDTSWLREVADILAAAAAGSGGGADGGGGGGSGAGGSALAAARDSVLSTFGRGASLETAIGTLEFLVSALGGKALRPRGSGPRSSRGLGAGGGDGDLFGESDAEDDGDDDDRRSEYDDVVVDLTANGGEAEARLPDGVPEPTLGYLRDQLSGVIGLVRSVERSGGGGDGGSGAAGVDGRESTSFNQLVSLVDLDTIQKRWLTQEYTNEGVIDEGDEDYDSDEDASDDGDDGGKGGAAGGGKGKGVADDAGGKDHGHGHAKLNGGRRGSSGSRDRTSRPIGWHLETLEYGPGVVSEDDEGNVSPACMTQFWYTAEDGETEEGPFTARQMAAWHEGGFFGDDFVCRIGRDGAPTTLGAALPLLAIASDIDAARLLMSAPAPAGVSEAEAKAHAARRDVSSWSFAVWDFSDDELESLTPVMFAALKLPGEFSIPADAFSGFVSDVREQMCRNDVPYHNFHHAFDVLQTCFVFLRSMGAFSLLQPLEALDLCLAALCHDLDHPGLNNAYQINAATELALQHNDQSVLENHHCVVAFRIMKRHNVMSGLTADQFRSSRKLIIRSILATDMTCHFGLTDDLKAASARLKLEEEAEEGGDGGDGGGGGGGGGEGESKGDEAGGGGSGDGSGWPGPHKSSAADREVLIKTLLHCADISNPCKAWDTSKKWSDLVCREFFAQGDREKAEGLPVSPNMDRKTTKQAQMSLGFIDFIVAPLFIAVTTVLPQIQSCCDTLDENRRRWDELLKSSIEAEEGDDAGAKEEAIQKLERRSTAFHQVLMPIAKEAAESASKATPGAKRNSMRRRSLNPLQSLAESLGPGSSGSPGASPRGSGLGSRSSFGSMRSTGSGGGGVSGSPGAIDLADVGISTEIAEEGEGSEGEEASEGAAVGGDA